MPEKVLIKKYNNRRLYDTRESSYINLLNMADLIKNGEQVKVIDAQTDEDVTAFTLTQIILEQGKSNQVYLPVSFLHLIIQHGEDILEESFEKYLLQIVDAYLFFKKQADQSFLAWFKTGFALCPPLPQDMEMPAMMSNPFLKAFFQSYKAPGTDE